MYLPVQVNTEYVPVHTGMYLNLNVAPCITIPTDKKGVFMCILCFHALAGCLQTYETLLKEINVHPGSAPVADHQYLVESVALPDHNFNLAC